MLLIVFLYGHREVGRKEKLGNRDKFHPPLLLIIMKFSESLFYSSYMRRYQYIKVKRAVDTTSEVRKSITHGLSIQNDPVTGFS